MSIAGLRTLVVTVLMNVLLVGMFFFLLNLYYKNSIKHRQASENFSHNEIINEKLLLRIGHFVSRRKESSFLNYEMKKNESVTRVGIFGDSHTFGDEVGAQGDFPSQLQEILGEKFEVLNFGQPWYSTAQSYLLWQEFHKKYQLDIVIFGPRGFYADRNITFNHTFDLNPYALHSRFIIKEGELVEVSPVGESKSEQFDRYYGFIPPSEYLYYDIRAPSFLKGLSSLMKREFVNPFYYLDDTGQEHTLLVQLFIKSMATQSKKFILLNDNTIDDIDSFSWVVKDIDGASFFESQSHVDYGFPFRAPKGHSTVFGNRLIAMEVAHHMKPDQHQDTNYLYLYFQAEDDDFEIYQGQKIAPLLLKDIHVYLQKIKVGQLYPISENFFAQHLTQDDQSLLSQSNQYLLGIQCEGERASQAIYLSLDQDVFEENLQKHPQDQRLLKHKELNNLFLLQIGDCISRYHKNKWEIDYRSSMIQSDTALSLGRIVWGDITLLKQTDFTRLEKSNNIEFQSDYQTFAYYLDADAKGSLFKNAQRAQRFRIGKPAE